MFKVNKSSWHYRFLTWYTVSTKRLKPQPIREWKAFHDKYGQLIDAYHETVGYTDPYKTVWEDDYFNPLPRNFCEYWRKTIINPALRIGFNIASYVGSALAFIYAYHVSGWTGFGIAGAMVAIILSGAAIFFGLCVLFSNINFGIKKKLRKFFIDADDDTLIGMAIKTHKEKVCVGVDYE